MFEVTEGTFTFVDTWGREFQGGQRLICNTTTMGRVAVHDARLSDDS